MASYNSADRLNSKKSLNQKLSTAKRAVQGAIIAAEINPITNEGVRYGAFGATLADTHSPLLGAAVLGGSTLLIEGASALAAAGILSSDRSSRVMNWVGNKTEKIVRPGAKIPPYGELGVAMTLGTPVLMTAKNIADPNRTLEQNRRHGLFTASWMAGVFTAEGGILGNSIENYNDPKFWAASAVALGGLAWVVKRSKSLMSKNKLVVEDDIVRNNLRNEDLGPDRAPLTSEQLQNSIRFYEEFRNGNDEAVKIGLYGHDLKAAFENPETVLFKYEGEANRTIYAPLLVPAGSLEWYNVGVLNHLYGEDKNFYYYAHPPIPDDPETRHWAQEIIKNKLDSGAVVITDQYLSQPESLQLLPDDKHYEIQLVGEGNDQKKDDVFVGEVKFEGVSEIKSAPPLFEIYQQALKSGKLEVDPHKGVALVDRFSDEDAEAIWEMYEKPFAKLGAEDPTYAGYDKKSLIKLLKDPEVAKIVYRDQGNIASLCFFVQNFDYCPWFNKSYYREKYPEYYDSGNIVIFPGIVSSEETKGSSYSGHLIDLAIRLYAMRGSNALMTFECTEVSTKYIPRIVKRIINNNGIGNVVGLAAPVSTKLYKTQQKVAQLAN